MSATLSGGIPYCPVGASSGPWQCDSYKQLPGSSNAAVAGDGGAGQRRQEAVIKLRQQMDPAARQHTETRTMPGMGAPSDDE